MGGVNAQYQGTKLNPQQEASFQSWKTANRPNDSGEDYDLPGAWLAQLKPDGRNHLDDEFKLQNHPTFSTGSKYSTPSHMGGEWSQANGRDTFEPSPWMESDPIRMQQLQQYMKAQEPNAILIRRPL
jgi:hypothetical protein